MYGLLQEWADSALFTISICVLSGSTMCFQLGVWLRVLALEEAPSHTQLVRLQQLN